ncbi:hypothetical protein Zmor_002437 [Zophobas morio]|uniref:Uncharacterized protein n=1 Tax=Zophobas morio TaxID=2755281 RepID=A0AA38MTN3_9CUCU|nr:hypothetical protein Zmor_002437 [Zophobas morio]
MGQPWMLVRAAAILLVTRQTLALSDIFEDGKSDKEILDHLLRATRYDKRLLPPVQGKGRINHLHDFIAFFDSAFDACVIT